MLTSIAERRYQLFSRAMVKLKMTFFSPAFHLHCQAEGETWTVSKVTTELWRAVVEGMGAQLVFSSVLLMRGKCVRPWREEGPKKAG